MRWAAWVALALVAVAGFVVLWPSAPSPAAPDTAANVGKCIQGQRVLYQVDRGEAAERCLAQLDAVGPARFARTWRGYETEASLW